MATYEERRDKRFYEATITALKDIHERALQLPQAERYAAAYGILRGYFESLLTNFAGAFGEQQLAEIRIVLDQLQACTGEDYHLDEATRAKRNQLAQQLRESEDSISQDWKAIEAQAKTDLENIQTDQDAYTFIDKYLLKELRHNYREIYRSDRNEMGRTPRQAIGSLLSLPPL